MQRFGDALNTNLHYHSIVLDGVYRIGERNRACFRALPPPKDEEVENVTRRIVRHLRALLVRRGLTADADIGDADPLAADEPLLAEIYAASVQGRTAMGKRAGRRLLRMSELVDPEETASTDSPRCTTIDGMSLHANVAVPARDRRRLERLCRYVARPPVATQRLSRLDDGRLLYRLKRRWRDGTTHILRAARVGGKAGGDHSAAALSHDSLPRSTGTPRQPPARGRERSRTCGPRNGEDDVAARSLYVPQHGPRRGSPPREKP